MANLRLSRRLEPEEGDPIWRTAESHTSTRLVLVHGARRRLQIDTDPPSLRLMTVDLQSEYAKYAKYTQYDLSLARESKSESA